MLYLSVGVLEVGAIKINKFKARHLLALSMATNGVSVVAFAMAYFVEEHRIPFYLGLHIASGFT